MREEQIYHRPNEHSTRKCDHDACFWKLEMGRLDEEAIWNVLTQRVTVLKGNEREQIRVRFHPDEDCTDYTGVVTCSSQGVHVLERGSEWTLIEAYSSADEECDVKIYADHFEGYVRSCLLMEREVDQTYGLVVDKLLQRMYVFKEGKLFTTLTVSTGLREEDASRLETPAGEYLIVSRVDEFWADDYLCAFGMRINKSILIHEVPRILRKDERTGREFFDTEICERQLGKKASSGCIRVQRRPTDEGVNARWLYENLHRSPCTKVIIWDDRGRLHGKDQTDG